MAFGDAICQGKSVYVLRKDLNKGDVELWDPLTGECYFFEQRGNEGRRPWGRSYMQTRFLDPHCPLKQLNCLVSEDNIYVNT